MKVFGGAVVATRATGIKNVHILAPLLALNKLDFLNFSYNTAIAMTATVPPELAKDVPQANKILYVFLLEVTSVCNGG